MFPRLPFLKRSNHNLPPRIVDISTEPQSGADAIPSEAAACTFCGTGATDVQGLVTGPGGVAICASCLERAQDALDTPIRHESTNRLVADLYRIHFRDVRRERQFLASISFFLTFAAVRFIVRSIQHGGGPFHNVSAGGKHIHHLVWGILGLLLVGYAWLSQVGTGERPPRRWMRLTSVLYGMGSALTLDEFALWLNLSDVYFTPEGRESIDAVALFGSFLSIGFWGHPFLRSLARVAIHKAKAAGATNG
ncbi:MAG TPA: ClpX C4-type zinc finger protein [Chloroflexota bacterium]|nr:ClpX C4-type zinc finger protein [Chloroflexota bacterium]